LAEALERVKRDLGRQAVILHTRTIKKGGVLGVGGKTLVEITASRDVNVLHPAERRAIIGPDAGRLRSGGTGEHGSRPARSSADGAAMQQSPTVAAVPRTSAIAPRPAEDVANFGSALRGEVGEIRAMVRELLARPSVLTETIPDLPDELREFYTTLIQNEVADEIAREVIATAKDRVAQWRTESANSGGGNSATLQQLIPAVLQETIERMLPPAEPVEVNAQAGAKYVALVGPTGVGKTTTIAKLAAHFKLREGRRVGLITIDTYRIAAVDQLRAYADILNIPLEIVLTPADMAAAVGRLKAFDLVLIDTSGRSQRDTNRLGELKQFLDSARNENAGQLETHLVLSCTSHPQQMMQVAEKFGQLGVDRIVFTKLDECVGVGVILNVTRRLNLHLSYLTTGQDVPDDIEVGHRRRIAQMVLARGGDGAVGGETDSVRAASVDQVA